MVSPFLAYILFAINLFSTENKCLSKKRQSARPLSYSMEQPAVVLFFTLKGLSPREFHSELE
jgi:hypothetical protein